jgi:hypothetical protein
MQRHRRLSDRAVTRAVRAAATPWQRSELGASTPQGVKRVEMALRTRLGPAHAADDIFAADDQPANRPPGCNCLVQARCCNAIATLRCPEIRVD